MNAYIQLICLFFSFLYGVIIYYLNIFSLHMVKKKNIISKIFLYVLYLNLISVIYIYTLFLLNGGVLHIYFILLIIIGYIFTCVKKRK